MKENRFIELLNLYVDQQLTATEATELEAELQRNLSRRGTYQQYCRMQKACAQLFEQERQSAPSTTKLSRALADAERIIAFPETRRVWLQRGIYATGVAAMAACVALVFFRPSPVTPQSIATQPAKPEPAAVVTAVAKVEPAATATTDAVQTVAIPPADPQTREMRKFYYAVLPVRQFVPVNAITTNGEQAEAEEKPDFAWMKNMEFAPLRPLGSGLAIETNSQNPQPPPSFIDMRRPVQLPYESSAFQYQKGN